MDAATEPAAFVRHMDILSGLVAIQAYKRETFALLEIAPGAHLLDAGCGPGTDAQQMAEMVGAADRVLVGSVDQIVDLLIERRQRYGFSYIVNWASIEEFAPVVARLAGR